MRKKRNRPEAFLTVSIRWSPQFIVDECRCDQSATHKGLSAGLVRTRTARRPVTSDRAEKPVLDKIKPREDKKHFSRNALNQGVS